MIFFGRLKLLSRENDVTIPALIREEKRSFHFPPLVVVLFHTRCLERFVEKADVDLLQASILIDHN